MDLGLKEKVVVCLSSAAGIGKGVAMELAREGARVVISSIESSGDELEAAAAAIEQETGNRPFIYYADIKSPEQIENMIHQAAKDLGGIYGLLNLCPGPKAGGFEAVNEADWADGYEKCLHSYIVAIRAALPYMKEAGEGRILNSTSSSIKSALDNLIISNTFRMGVVGLSKSLAREVAAEGILVNTIGPGRIYTERIKYLNTMRAEKAGMTEEEYTKKDSAGFPQKRYQTAEEYGKIAAFLLSPANGSLSGQAFLCDGAMTTAY